MFSSRAANLRYEETLQFSLKWLFSDFDIATEVAIYNKGNGFVDLFVITDKAYYVVELKNLSLERFVGLSQEDLRKHQDPRQLSYTSYFPPSKENSKSNSKPDSKKKSYKVQELLDAATHQVNRYAKAVQQGTQTFDAHFGNNSGWVTVSKEQLAKDIPIYPLVIILLGGACVVSDKLPPLTTRVQYIPGEKLVEWKGFLKTLNSN